MISVCRGYSPIPSSFVAYHVAGGRSDTVVTACPSTADDFTLGVWWSAYFSIFGFLCGFESTIACCFVLFLLTIVLSVFFRITVSGCPVVIFKHTRFIKILGFNRNPSQKR